MEPCELDSHAIKWHDASNAGGKKAFHWSEPHHGFVEIDEDGMMSNTFKFKECTDDGLVIYDEGRHVTLLLPFSFGGPAPIKYKGKDDKAWADLFSLMAFRDAASQVEFTVQ